MLQNLAEANVKNLKINNNGHIVQFLLSASHVAEAILQLLLHCAGSLHSINCQMR